MPSTACPQIEQLSEEDPKPRRTRSNVRKRQAVVAVRLLPREHERLLDLAHARGVPVAEVLRQALLRDLPA